MHSIFHWSTSISWFMMCFEPTLFPQRVQTENNEIAIRFRVFKREKEWYFKMHLCYLDNFISTFQSKRTFTASKTCQYITTKLILLTLSRVRIWNKISCKNGDAKYQNTYVKIKLITMHMLKSICKCSKLVLNILMV